MTDLTIHLYALVWNERPLLPFFLEHYRPFVDRFFLFDDGSDDGSWEYLAEQPDVSLTKFDSTGNSFVEKARAFYCDGWKASRGKADFVIVVIIDELTYHPSPRAALRAARDEKITVVDTRGWEMVGDALPLLGPLAKAIPQGVHSRSESKIAIFDPEAIREINYGPGRHQAGPQGRVLGYKRPLFDLLHYKYLSADYVVARYRELGQRMREGDVRSGYGTHYRKTDEELRNEHKRLRAAAVPVLPAAMKEAGLLQEPYPGICVAKLREVSNEKGGLQEIWRSDDAFSAPVRQVYTTTTRPNVVKAWYKHEFQTDQVMPLSGKGRMILVDTRIKGSMPSPVMIKMDAENPTLIVVPPMIWHGFQAVGEEPLVLLHMNDRPFDHITTDEVRMMPDDPLFPFRWPE